MGAASGCWVRGEEFWNGTGVVGANCCANSVVEVKASPHANAPAMKFRVRVPFIVTTP
jgi:hypothetical protein